MPFERDPDTDIVRINNVPNRLQHLDHTYKLEARLLSTPGVNLCVVTRHYDTVTRSYFYAIYCPGKRHVLQKVIIQEGGYQLHGHHIVP